MPRITGPKQLVRPAIATARPAIRQTTIAAKVQTPRATARATAGTTVLSAPQATMTRAPQMAANTTCCCVACTGLQCLDRTRFFSGQLLSESDLNNEQSYMLAKNRLHNRYLAGWGVVCGLQVTCSDCAGWVNINPGYAIDPCGNDIIVCAAQSFNIIQAIQACCTPATQTPNCSPLRYSPSPTCQDAQQQWCITVQYQEQQSNMVTPLQQTSSGASTCSSGSSTSGCGCGSNGSNGSSMNSSSSTSSSAQTGTTTAACEATRIIEGFQFSVSPVPAAGSSASQPGTLVYQIEQCTAGLTQLAQQAPDLEKLDSPAGSPAGAQLMYQAMCNYVFTVQQYFAQTPTLTNCKVLDVLSAIIVPTVASGADIAAYRIVKAEVGEILIAAYFECLCLALLPQCPPAACDNRVPLACVTIQNGVVKSICHFQCRKQLIGYTALNYWLEPLFAALGTLFDELLDRFCCPTASKRDPNSSFHLASAFATSNVTTSGITNAAVFNRAVSSYVTQKMGASMVNAVNPNLNAVDMRAYVGQPLETARDSLIKAGFTADKLDIQNVDADPSWDAAAVAAGSQLAPGAVTSGQPLTLYVKGQSIVGIEVTDPTRTLQLQVQTLSQQVAALQSQLNNTGSQTGFNQVNPAAGTAPGAGTSQ
jgi:hypothetical protein